MWRILPTAKTVIFVVSLWFCAVGIVSAQAAAQPPTTAAGLPICTTDPSQPGKPSTTINLAGEIDEFLTAGAAGYLVWQYSGDAGLGTEFASDPYAFFRNRPEGTAICSTLKAAADKHPGKFIGVNMWDAGNSKHSEAKVADHFSWLKNTCGVTVIRTFSKEGGAQGAQKLMNAATSAGVKVMFAIGDYSNGGGGIPSGVDSSFYTTGYTGEFQTLATDVMNATSGNGALFGYELANEAHCRGDQAAVTAYRNWGEYIGAILGRGSSNVGYGQKASENTTMCDSPGVNVPSGPSHFEYTNSASNITMTSGHYYNTAEKSLALEALTQSKGLLNGQGKMYYVGEAPATIRASDGTTVGQQCVPREKYYIQPINGVNGITETALTTENPTGNQLDVIRDELIMQGYEARCAAPGFRIKLSEDGRDAMNKLFEQPGINGVVVGGAGGGVYTRTDTTAKIYSRLDVDYRDILVPLFRDPDRADPQLKRSIEDYFGHKETNDAVYTSSELKTAAINSLLSNQQRCTVAYQNLVAQDEMCKKLADPSLCALYETEIPNTAYTVRTLLQKFETARAGDDVITFCGELMGASSGGNDNLRKGMANAPLTIEKAYRLAFMVTSIRLRTPNPSKLLNLFTHPLGGWLGPPKPKHAVAVVAFKIPDMLTNKGYNDGYTVDTAYDDTGKLTRNSLLRQDQQEEVEAEALTRRRQLLDKARVLADVVHHDSWAEIECLGGGTKTDGVGSPQCKDPLSKALVDIINAQAVLGKDLVAAPATTGSNAEADEGKLVDTGKVYDFSSLLDQYEEDGELSCEADFETGLTINDPGVINAPNDPSHVFTQNYGAALLANLFGDCTHDGMGSGSPSFASTQDPSTVDCGEDWYLKSKFFVVQGMLAGNDDEDALAVKHFLVYPTGYDLRTVEGVLAGSFFTKQQLADILELQENSPSETEKITDQFRLENGKVVFNGGEGGYSYTDQVNCEERSVFQPATNTWVTITKCPERSFGFRLFSTMPKAANILGGTVGYWMRTIQTNLNATTQKSYDYLKTCASLEEFLTDRCGGGAVGAVPPGQSGNAPGDNGNWVGDRCLSTTTLEQVGYNGPTILPITGKATYYGSGVFNSTLNTRLSGAAGNDFKGNTTVKNCELPGATIGEAESEAAKIGQEYVGCVAMLRMGDLWFRNAWERGNPDPNAIRKVWLRNDEGVIHGPFAVIDVAAERHAACLYDENWAVDIDYNSFNRLFGQTAGPDRATVCDDKDC